MPHVPVPVEASPMGPACPWCGPMPPIFTCTICGTTQGLYMPGMSVPPAQGPGIAPLVAPVAQAPQGAAPHQVHSGLQEVANEFAGAFGKQLGQGVANSVGAWMS